MRHALCVPSPRIAVFVSFSGRGGVERMIVNLCGGLAEMGCRVDLLLVKARSGYLTSLHPAVRTMRLGGHTLSSLPALARYLRQIRPEALLAAKDRANQTAVVARALARAPTRVVLRMGTTVTAALDRKGPLQHLLWRIPMRVLYPRADAVVAVSGGVAGDLARMTGLPASRFYVIPNPVITPRLYELAAQPVPHPWLQASDVPVLLAAGRLTRQKDFATLLRAFQIVRSQRRLRLIILGEGQDRPSLEALIGRLHLDGHVELAGFVQNPYAYMARAALFVLSSAWEGSPNSLTEAMALGTPVVSTDCPSGPREILADGRYGPLVPVGNAAELAAAVLRTLAAPPKKALLSDAVSEYSVEKSSRRYLDLLLGPKPLTRPGA